MLLFSERGYYPIRTIYRSAGVDVFLCRKLGEEGIYTVNRVKAVEMVSFCLTDGRDCSENFLEAFLWEQEYFIVYRWFDGQTIRDYLESKPEQALNFMEALCKKILICRLHPALLYQILEEDCICVRDGEICLNCFFRFPLCWEQIKKESLPEKVKELLDLCVSTCVKKDIMLWLLLRKFIKEFERQFQKGLFTEMLPLYFYITKATATYRYKSFSMLKKEYRDKIKVLLARVKLWITAAAAVLAVVVVYWNWITKLREGMP